MKIIVSPKAAAWYKEEVGIKPGFGIRFKSKIYANSPVNEGFGLAFDTDEPVNPIAQTTTENGILFFVEENDEWFFNQHDLQVDFNEQLKEPKYVYLKDGIPVE
ncbi:TPA: HesB/YadR/YfhF family protein [Streptococcus suis]